MVQLSGMVVAFVVIIIMLNRRLSLGLAMGTAVVILAVTSGLEFVDVMRTCLSALVATDTIELVLSVLGITIMSAAMGSLGLLERAVASLCDLTRRPRAVVVTAPSLVGLLPVPGGAIISAPLIDGLGGSMGMSPDARAAANMLFRHAWFLVFPFNPHLILASRIADLPLSSMIACQAVPAVVCFVMGYLILFSGTHPERCELAGTPRLVAARDCFLSLSPLLVALLTYALFPIRLPVALLAGILVAAGIAWRTSRLRETAEFVSRKGIDGELLVTVTAIMVFRAFMMNMDQLPAMVGSVLDRGLPIELFLIVLPFAIAFASAYMSTATAVCFPLLLGAAATVGTKLGFTTVIYTLAFVGHMLSPAHPCGPLTATYFKVSFTRMSRLYLPVLLAAGAASVVVLVVLRAAG